MLWNDYHSMRRVSLIILTVFNLLVMHLENNIWTLEQSYLFLEEKDLTFTVIKHQMFQWKPSATYLLGRQQRRCNVRRSFEMLSESIHALPRLCNAIRHDRNWRWIFSQPMPLFSPRPGNEQTVPPRSPSTVTHTPFGPNAKHFSIQRGGRRQHLRVWSAQKNGAQGLVTLELHQLSGRLYLNG